MLQMLKQLPPLYTPSSPTCAEMAAMPRLPLAAAIAAAAVAAAFGASPVGAAAFAVTATAATALAAAAVASAQPASALAAAADAIAGERTAAARTTRFDTARRADRVNRNRFGDADAARRPCDRCHLVPANRPQQRQAAGFPRSRRP